MVAITSTGWLAGSSWIESTSAVGTRIFNRLASARRAGGWTISATGPPVSPTACCIFSVIIRPHSGSISGWPVTGSGIEPRIADSNALSSVATFSASPGLHTLPIICAPRSARTASTSSLKSCVRWSAIARLERIGTGCPIPIPSSSNARRMRVSPASEIGSG